MTNQELFDAWGPASAKWSPWVKPVLFSQLDVVPRDEIALPAPPFDLAWVADFDQATAIVADLPGAIGVFLALRLAAFGYRPVPLYNACPAPSDCPAVVDVGPILTALAAAALPIVEQRLPDDAPPVFLLDANRNPATTRMAGQFDNRSISLPTDFPSAHLLLSSGIQRVVVVQAGREMPPADLSHTLRRWQEAGLKILVVDIDKPEPPRSIVVPRPNGFRMLWHNLLAKIGLKANPLGGFGGRLPMPSTG